MREIRFRGKHKDGGWEHGCLSVGREGYEIVNTDGMGLFFHCPVDPSTVGQYTGLKDKNGKDIYEGDVVILTRRIAPYYGCPEEDMKTVYTTTKAIFDSGSFWLTGDRFSDNCHFHYNAEDREIIGNIHDDPDLLEGGEKA